MAQRSRLTPLLAVAGLGGVGLLLWAASSAPAPAAVPPPLPDPQGPPEPAPMESKPAGQPTPAPATSPYQPPPGATPGETGPAFMKDSITDDGWGRGPRVEDVPPVWPPGDPAPSVEPPPPDDALQAYRLGWWNADATARGVESLVEGVYGQPPASPVLSPWYALGRADRQASRPPRYAVAQQPPSGAAGVGSGNAPPGSLSTDPDIAQKQRECYVLGCLHRDAQDPQRRYYFTVATDRPPSFAEWQRWWDLGYQQRAEGRAPLFPVEMIDSGTRPVPQVDSRKGGL